MSDPLITDLDFWFKFILFMILMFGLTYSIVRIIELTNELCEIKERKKHNE